MKGRVKQGNWETLQTKLLVSVNEQIYAANNTIIVKTPFKLNSQILS